MNTSNGDQVERAEHRKSLNPFATEEDSDEEDEGKDEFTVGDLEVEEEGKGHLPPNTGLQGKGESIESLLNADKNVGIPDLELSSWNSSTAGSGGSTRATFPSMWPFGSSSPGPKHSFALQDTDGNSLSDRNHFRGANHADYVDKQSSDDSDNSSDDGYGDRGVAGTDFGSDGQGYGGKRRLSVTTEAKRRTSLEDDDDDEEVVHVALAEAEAHAEGKGEAREGEADDGELVEIQHAEMQGVEGEGVSEK